MDYGTPNEVAFAEVSPGVYRVNEILTFSALAPLQLFQEDMTSYERRLKGFATAVQGGMCLLGDTMKIQDLLLPNGVRYIMRSTQIFHVSHVRMRL